MLHRSTTTGARFSTLLARQRRAALKVLCGDRRIGGFHFDGARCSGAGLGLVEVSAAAGVGLAAADLAAEAVAGFDVGGGGCGTAAVIGVSPSSSLSTPHRSTRLRSRSRPSSSWWHWAQAAALVLAFAAWTETISGLEALQQAWTLMRHLPSSREGAACGFCLGRGAATSSEVDSSSESSRIRALFLFRRRLGRSVAGCRSLAFRCWLCSWNGFAFFAGGRCRC